MSDQLFNALTKGNYKYSFLRQYLKDKSMHSRSPFAVSLELTPVCNLNCEICYIRMTNREVIDSGNHVMDFAEWKYYIDGFIDMNACSFTLTGGECMLHPDFVQIYKYIYDAGKQVNLITNLSCMTDEILDLFVHRPPEGISITIYGGSEKIYGKFCKNSAAFEKVIKNIDRLIENHLPITLQTTIGKDNINDFDNILDIATQRGLNLITTETLTNYGKCDNEKLDNVQVDFLEFADINHKARYHKHNYLDEQTLKEYIFPTTDNDIFEKGYNCYAAKNACAINWKGLLRPCVSFEAFLIDPRENGGIKECWNKLVEWGNNVPATKECINCLFYHECKHCIALHYNDTHELGKVSPRLCFKIQHPEEAAKLQAEYDRRQALKKAEETKE